MQNMEGFNDQPIARGVGDTATDAIKTCVPCNGERRKVGMGEPVSDEECSECPKAAGSGAGGPARI